MNTWKMVSLLGKWHKCAINKAFRFYLRINKDNRKAYFADYRIDDLVSCHHFVDWFESETPFTKANQILLSLTREELSKL